MAVMITQLWRLRPAEPPLSDSHVERPTNRGLGHGIRQPNSLIRRKFNGGILREQINCLATNQVSPTVAANQIQRCGSNGGGAGCDVIETENTLCTVGTLSPESEN